MIKCLLENTIFKLFLQEIETLGFTVSASPRAGALHYAIIGGRSNARWWLVPLTNRHIATSGLALFQPTNLSAQILKRTATALNAVGLSSLWARNRVYVSCPPVFSDLFDDKNLSYAFFTGTDSPHRKTAIQVMGSKGEIKGFAKLSRQKAVKQLISYEGNYLEYIHSLNLKSTYTPRILLNSEISEARILVTDTQKTRYSKSPVTFTKYHEEFLTELAHKSKNDEQLHCSQFLMDVKLQVDRLATRLTEEWNNRLTTAIQRITHTAPSMKADMVSCHGDFTPWNTFMVDEKLYVFDWEYGQQAYPPGYDLIHFHFSLPATKRHTVHESIRRVRKLLNKTRFNEDDTYADTLILCYVCGHSLRYIEREALVDGKIATWIGEEEAADIVDALLGTI